MWLSHRRVNKAIGHWLRNVVPSAVSALAHLKDSIADECPIAVNASAVEARHGLMVFEKKKTMSILSKERHWVFVCLCVCVCESMMAHRVHDVYIYDKDAEISMDSGERLPMSTGVSPSLCNLHGNGTTDVGLFGSYYADPLFRGVAGLPPCSDEPGTVDWAPRGDIGFASVSDYATAAAKNGAIECMSDSLDFQEAVAERLMDVDDPDTMARELFWATANAATASNGYALFKNATTYADEKWDSIRRCHQVGGGGIEDALDQARLRALRDAGRLLVYDLSYLETLSASQEDLPVGKTFGSQAFFEVEDALVDGDRSVKALAICLSTLEDGTSEERTVRVYTPELSPGAFAIAAWHFRASVENYFVFVSHMYELHLRHCTGEKCRPPL